MKTATIIMVLVGLVLGAVFAVGYAEQRVEEEKTELVWNEQPKLVLRNGLWYEINSGVPFTGIANTYGPDGQQASEIEYLDGLPQGKYRAWEDGDLIIDLEYDDGECIGGIWVFDEIMNQLEPSDLVHSTLCDPLLHKPITGVVVTLNANSQKVFESEFRNGKVHGRLILWYGNGQKMSECEFLDGVRHGKLTNWYEDGQIEMEAEYRDGKKISRKRWDKEGNRFSGEGQGNVDLVKRDGLLYAIDSEEPFTGIAYEYWSGWQIYKKTEYRDGLRNGKDIWWHKSGHILKEAEYRNDVPDGVVTWWQDNGYKCREFVYRDGKDASYKNWDESGTLRIENQYDLDGNPFIKKSWDEEGNLIWEKDYSLIGNYAAPTPGE